MFVECVPCQVAELVVRNYLSPSGAYQAQAGSGSLSVSICYLLIAVQAGDSTANFDEARPPDYHGKPSVAELRLRTGALIGAQRNERAGVPERGRFLHRSSLSASRASTALLPFTVPVG